MIRAIGILMLLAVLVGAAFAQDGGVVREILIRGNERISAEFIKQNMITREGGPYIRTQLQDDETAIGELGVFQAVDVTARPLEEGLWQVVVDVVENPLIREIRFVGNTVIPTEELLGLVTQQTDQVFNTRTVRSTVQAIQDLYTERGYFAQADMGLLEDLPNTLTIQIIELRVRNIIVNGLDRTNERVIRQLIRTEPGKALSAREWGNDQRRLWSTQWFESIEPDQNRDTGEIGQIDLILNVVEAPTGQFLFGAALDPRSRLAGSLRYNDTNFRGSGQTVGLGFQQDTFGSGLSVTADWVNPFYDARGSTLAIRAYSRVNSYFTGSGFGGSDSPSDDESFDERRTGASITFTRPVNREVSLTAGIRGETIRTIDLRTDTESDYIQQDGDLGVLTLAVQRDRRDVPLDPAQGDYVRLSLEPGISRITRIGGDVGDVTDALGTNTFVRSMIEYKAFFSRDLRPDERPDTPRPVLALRARYGAIGGTVPFFEQFFVGGADSLRGYGDQRFWGSQAVMGTVEYRYPIQRSFTLVGFVDAASAWGGYGTINDFDQSSALDMKLGYGLGLAFRTPLGPIRVDYGINSEGGSRVHFSIGGRF